MSVTSFDGHSYSILALVYTHLALDVPSVQLYTYKDLDTSRVYTKLKSNKRMEETLTQVQARTSYSLKQEIKN